MRGEILYNLIKTPDGYRMAKFDEFMNVDAVYHIQYRRGRFYCDCPAMDRPTCRHREMVETFNRHRAVNSGKFYCYEEEAWYPPVTG